jgi:glycosyltransferase involved in cell wall biosynthesis
LRVAIDCRKIGDFGIGTYVRGLLSALVRLADDVTYVAIGPAAIAEHLPDEVERIDANARNYSFGEIFTIGRAIEASRADVFHAPHYVVPATNRPVVVTIHDLIHLHQPQQNPLAPLYARFMLRRAVRKSARVLTVSASVAAEVVRELHADPARIVVTPNGISDRFRAEAQVGRLSNYFLFVGNDKPHKDVGTLVRAFAITRREDSRFRLILCGGAFERFAAEEGVECRGFVDDDELLTLYRGAIALVVPSLEEGFGLPAAEAMACGTPVITSDAPALVEITGNAALHVGRGRTGDLAAKMLELARDREMRLSLSRRGIERARDMTWRRCAEATRDAYRDAIEARK